MQLNVINKCNQEKHNLKIKTLKFNLKLKKNSNLTERHLSIEIEIFFSIKQKLSQLRDNINKGKGKKKFIFKLMRLLIILNIFERLIDFKLSPEEKNFAHKTTCTSLLSELHASKKKYFSSP